MAQNTRTRSLNPHTPKEIISKKDGATPGVPYQSQDPKPMEEGRGTTHRHTQVDGGETSAYPTPPEHPVYSTTREGTTPQHGHLTK